MTMNDFGAFRARLAASGGTYETREDADLAAISEALATIEKRTAAVDDLDARLSAIETRAARPGAGLFAAGGDAITREQRDHIEAFREWLRAPADRRAAAALAEAENAALAPGERRLTSGLSGGAGGHAIPAPVAADIVRRVTQISPIRRLARTINVTSTATKFPLDRAGTAHGWVAENATRTGTAEPTLDLRAPTYGTEYCLVSATEEIVMDAAIDIAGWLADSAVVALAAAEGAAFVSGDGTNKPTGFLAGPTPVTTADASRASGTLQYVPSGNASALTADALVNLYYAVKAEHRAGATWVMSSATAAAVQLLKDGQQRSLWSPALAENTPATLLGRPVAYAEDMPAVAANTFPIAFGNFNAGYLIADQGGLRVTYDEVTTPGLVRWYVRRRVGGTILDSEAIKLLKVATS
jgi:HK97 family phage major capsid protein